MARRPTRPPTTLDALVDHGKVSGRPAADLLADVATVLAGRITERVVDPDALALRTGTPDRAVTALLRDAPAGDLVPDLLGQVHEGLLDAGHRRRRGVFYTPPAIAAGVAALVDWPGGDDPPRVCDPAVGGGAFLLAAARVLAGRGHQPADIVERSLYGVDVDPLAAAVARSALVLWAAETDRVPVPPTIVVGDSLVEGAAVWEGAEAPAGGFDVVLGNPPFQSQLGRDTARPVAGAEAERLRERFGPVAYRYTDSAALFLLEACRWACPGGQVALVLPQSVLAANDTDALRRAVLELGEPERLWVAGEAVFTASVRVCVAVIRRAGGAPGHDPDAGTVELFGGRGFTPAGAVPVDAARWRAEPSWAFLRSRLSAVPPVDLPVGPAGVLGSRCEATAGFRDQFYGLAPFVDEATGPADDRPRLVTCGLLDPARCRWGERPTRFAGRRFAAPVVALDRLRADGPAALAAWAGQRLVPKVVVATQTRVLEAAVDEEGRWFPSVPTIALTCPHGTDPAALWEAAAVVLAPPASAWAFGRHGGAALSDDALKVSARQLLDLPLPAGRASWVEGAGVLGRVAAATDEASWRRELGEFGALLCDAYGVGDGLLAWWMARLPPWR